MWCAAAATVVAMVCPAWLSTRSLPFVVVAHGACMARTFSLQIGVALLIVGACAWAARARWAGLLACALALAWLAPEAWKQARPLRGSAADGSDSLTVMTVNAQFGVCDAGAVAREAAACRADVIVLQEFTGELRQRLDSVLAEYPHRVSAPRDDAYGQGVYSRRSFVSSEVEPGIDGVNDHPRASVVVHVDGVDVRISNVHLVSPISVERVIGQRLEAAWLAADVRKRLANTGELLMVGDFNGTPDGSIVGAFLSEGLVDGWAESSRGRGGTWPAAGLSSKLGRIRIDNLLSSRGLVCIASGVGSSTGSDHLPTWGRYVHRVDRESAVSMDDREKRVK